GTPPKHVVHMCGLIVEDSRLPPSPLFLDPIAEVSRNDGVDIGSDLGVSEQIDWIGRVKDLLEIVSHGNEPLCSVICWLSIAANPLVSANLPCPDGGGLDSPGRIMTAGPVGT